MSTEENKAVVRRWMTEVLQGGDLDTLRSCWASRPDAIRRLLRRPSPSEQEMCLVATPAMAGAAAAADPTTD